MPQLFIILLILKTFKFVSLITIVLLLIISKEYCATIV